MESIVALLACFPFLSGALAVPAPAPVAAPIAVPVAAPAPEPQLLPVLSSLSPNLTLPNGGISPSLVPVIIAGIQSDISDGTQAASAYAALLKAVVPTRTPTSIPEVNSFAASAFPTTVSSTTDLIQDVANLIGNGIKPDSLNILANDTFDPTGVDSFHNVNLRNPFPPVYPRKELCDAPYSVSEYSLRSAIYIPTNFTYGRKQPVILTPGTGGYGGSQFANNFIKTLQATGIFDPVWLNIPGALLADAQVNAEYVAYALNYIPAITGRSVGIVAWSQGNLDTQWALKYWPSTNKLTTDFIGISPDYHGTVLAYLLAPDFPKIPADPSVIQQTTNSSFVTTLLSNGGDSAYVPTTNVYSIFDEIVQPQADPNASGHLDDARHVGVTNNELQTVCPNQPAGGTYTHEGVLYNPIAYALAIDALTHRGPGLVSRIDLPTYCAMTAAPGLTLEDVAATEAVAGTSAANVLLYPNKVFEEPAIMPYAAKNSSWRCY